MLQEKVVRLEAEARKWREEAQAAAFSPERCVGVLAGWVDWVAAGGGEDLIHDNDI